MFSARTQQIPESLMADLNAPVMLAPCPPAEAKPKLGRGESKIKILFFADTHLGFDYPVRPIINRRRRGFDFFENYNRIFKYAAEKRPDLVIHGGDYFFRSKVPAKIIDLAYEPLFKFVESTKIPFYIVPGNHERSVLPKSIFLNHPLINIFHKPQTFLLKIRNIEIQLSGFPFIRKIRDSFQATLQQCGWDNNSPHIKLLCMHQAIEGAKVGPSNYTFRMGKDVIKKSALPQNASAVLSGHIHRKQLLYKNEIPVIYPGSIERTSFAEKEETKGFYELFFSENNNQLWSIDTLRFLRLSSRPMADIYLLPLSDNNLIESEVKSKIQNLPTDAIIRFRCKTTPNSEFKSIFSSSFIRNILPFSMNFQFGTEFYGNP